MSKLSKCLIYWLRSHSSICFVSNPGSTWLFTWETSLLPNSLCVLQSRRAVLGHTYSLSTVWQLFKIPWILSFERKVAYYPFIKCLGQFYWRVFCYCKMNCYHLQWKLTLAQCFTKYIKKDKNWINANPSNIRDIWIYLGKELLCYLKSMTVG